MRPEDFADRLRAPVEGEDAFVAKFANNGASEDDLDTAAAAFRLLKSLGSSVSVGDQEREPIAKTDEERKRTADEARRANETIRKHLEAKTVTKPTRSAAESLAEVERIEKEIERMDDAKADQRIEEAASRLRKSNPSLSKAQAVVDVLKADPDLYTSHLRHVSRQTGYLNDDPREVQKSDRAWSAVEEAAVELRKSAPELTQQQAIARVLKEQPTLYQEL